MSADCIWVNSNLLERATMTKAYTAHEACYRELRESGCTSWDHYHQAASGFDTFHMRSFMEMLLARSSFSFPAVALEIGCGTGPLCCFLALQGFQVDGVDISATAIAMAKEEAPARGLSVRYRVADVCRDSLGSGQYMLIVDGHCLHCIVEADDRRQALANIRDALADDGQFWLDSMLMTDTTTFGDPHHLDSAGVLWTRIEEEGEFSDQVCIDGKWYLPTRKLHSGSEAFALELQQAGFSIQWSRVVPPDRADEPAGFQAICGKDE